MNFRFLKIRIIPYRMNKYKAQPFRLEQWVTFYPHSRNIFKYYGFIFSIMEIMFPYKRITSEEYPELDLIIEKQKAAWGIKNLKKYIWLWHEPWGANAFAISFFGDRLVLTEALLKIMRADEMEGIIAHEFSHLYHRDSLKWMSVWTLLISPMLLTFLLYFVARSLNIIDDPLIQSLLIVALLISLPIWLSVFKVGNRISVESESRADRDAVLKTSNSDAFKRSLIKLYDHKYKVNCRPSKFFIVKNSIKYVSEYFLCFTHPGLRDRIENIEFSRTLE
jgi:Zn-dependent protease with chaperone function